MGLPIHHLAVVVADLERAERFYGGVLGLPVLRRWDDEVGRARSVWLELGAGAFLAVEKGDAPSTTPAGPRGAAAPGWHCVALAIDRGAREDWRRRLAEAGHPVERETVFTLYARDPEGNLVALSHWPEEALDPPAAPR